MSDTNQGQDPDDVWRALEQVTSNDADLARNKIVSAARTHPAHRAFDMLRTRLMQAMTERSWTSIAITSPTSGCGKSFVAANLAFTMSRLEGCKTILMDLDLRTPNLADIFGITASDPMQDYLSGIIDPRDFLLRTQKNLALGLNSTPSVNASELFQSTMTADVLEEMQDMLMPTVVIYDLPPALDYDDVLAFLPRVDGVLLVAAGGLSTSAEITKTEQLIVETKPLLGVVLNKADGTVMV